VLLDEAIWTHLSAVAAITAVIPATNIQWSEAAQETTANRIVYRMISAPPQYDSDDEWQRWEVVIIHSNKWTCRQVANLVSDNLHRFKGDNEGQFGGMDIDYIAKISDRDPVLLEDDTYEIIQEYRFIFH